jgi:hypothetical protein
MKDNAGLLYVSLKQLEVNGHSIYDKRMGEALGNKGVALMSLPSKWLSIKNVRKLRSFDCVVLSHYSTFFLLIYLLGRRVVLINHDLPQGAYFISGGFKNFLKGVYFYFKINLARVMCSKVFCISMRESSLMKSEILRVGCSPLRIPAPTTWRLELYLSGNYQWSLKRNSLERFMSSYDGCFQSLIEPGCDVLSRSFEKYTVPELRNPKDFTILRVGIIFDDFLSGFKLKSLDLIVKNCIIISFADIREEFAHIPGYEKFVIYVRDYDEFKDFLNNLVVTDETLIEFSKFKSSVIDSFSWKIQPIPY